jgi:hypothetical protein
MLKLTTIITMFIYSSTRSFCFVLDLNFFADSMLLIMALLKTIDQTCCGALICQLLRTADWSMVQVEAVFATTIIDGDKCSLILLSLANHYQR